ncbi:hypothetical protein LDO31_17905 [Luteimonas sp. XNQY3]|nr:hypothetical protein [Luteimonas sp. XNQY3]
MRARFIVRSLGKLRGDAARFVAAAQAVALSHAFDALRRSGGMVDVKKLLESAQRAVEGGADRPWTASNFRVGGVDFGTVATSGREDTLDFIEVMKAADELVAKSMAGSEQTKAPAAPSVPATPLLSEEIASQVSDLEQRKLSRDIITESKHRADSSSRCNTSARKVLRWEDSTVI